MLGLLQINPPITLLRQELLGKLFKIFLAAHANSATILTHAWHSQSIQIKPILMLSMADWYLKAAQEGDNEHSRLSRILDVAQFQKRHFEETKVGRQTHIFLISHHLKMYL